MTEELLVERSPDGAVVTVTFNRPERLNAITAPMYDRLHHVVSRLPGDEDAVLLVLRGAGRAFAAGNEIGDFQALGSTDAVLAHEERIRALLVDLEAVPQVTLAAVDGPAVGGGLAFALACDLRMATARSRFGYPIARTLGNALSADLLAATVRTLGEPLTRHLLLTSRLVGPDALAAVGALTAVVEDAEALQGAVAELADGLRRAARATLRTTKEQLAELRAGRPDPVREERRLRAAYGGPEFAEGVAAFLERRTPDFRARR